MYEIKIISQVLKAYNVSGPAMLTTLPGKIWNALTEANREIVEPLLSSMYSRSNSKQAYNIPIYKSGPTTANYQGWISSWCCHLIDTFPPKETSTEIFVACKAAIKKNGQTAQFLLPYLVMIVICRGDETRGDIKKEIDAVTEEDVVNDNGNPIQIAENSTPGKFERMATQTIFSVLDHLSKWLANKHNSIQSNLRRSETVNQVKFKHKDYIAVEAFLDSISQRSIAWASFRCQAYARALMHYEQHIAKHPEEFQKLIFTLQKVYSSLQVNDYVHGLEASRKSDPTIEELIFQHETSGKFGEALACYESIGRNEEKTQEGIIRCYLETDQPMTAARLAESLAKRNETLRRYQLEAAWQLSQWKDITNDDDTLGQNWNSDLAKLLKDVRDANRKGFYDRLQVVQRNQMVPITTAAMEQGSYERSYEHLVNLQIIDEVRSVSETVMFPLRPPPLESLENLFSGWKTRSTVSQYSSRFLEPVLRVRRSLMELSLEKTLGTAELQSCITSHLGECWLLAAKVARKSNQYNKAYTLLLKAERFGYPELFLERAKLSWARGRSEEAIDTLKKGIKDKFPWWTKDFSKKSHRAEVTDRDLSVCADAKLLLARYIDEAAILEAESIPVFYNEARALTTTSEDVFYYSAKFYDKMINDSTMETKGDILSHVVKQYARSLFNGCSNIHETLPRMLSLWLDYGSKVAALAADKKNPVDPKILGEMQKYLAQMNDLLKRFSKTCPTYYYLSTTTFQLLTSRICHSHREVYDTLKFIIVECFIRYLKVI